MRRIRTTQTSTAPAPVLGVYTWTSGQDLYLYGSAYWTESRPQWAWSDAYDTPFQVGVVGSDRDVGAVVLLENAQIGLIQTGQIDAALAGLGLRVAT